MRTRHLASLSLALTLGAATVAAAQTTTTPAEPAPGQTVEAPAAAPASTETGPQSPHRHWRHHHSRLFRGVQLTPDERAKLATIREQYRAQFKPLVHQIRTARHSMRTAAAGADTAAVSAARATMRDVRSKFAAVRSQWESDARGVLTPDQQAQFDKNVARMKEREAARGSRKSS
jgi:Spy/CpxP family protein refolding chaperone